MLATFREPQFSVCWLTVSIPEFNESSPLDRTLDLANVTQTKIHQLLVFVLAQPSNEALTRQWLAQSECSEPVFREAEVEERCHWNLGRAKLFLLFGEIRPANEADGAFVTEDG